MTAAAVAGLGLVTSAAAPAKAGLLGKTMDAVYYYPDASSPYANASFTPSSFTVGPGVETVGDVEGVTSLPVDFTDSTLTITLDTVLTSPTWGTASFNGIIFTSANPLGIAGAAVDAATTMAGFDNSRVSFNSDQIFVNWEGLSYNNGTVVKVDFAAVPEPGSLALLAAGLAGLGLVGLRRRSVAAGAA